VIDLKKSVEQLKSRKLKFILIGTCIIQILLIFINTHFSANTYYSMDNIAGDSDHFSKELESSVYSGNLTEVISPESTESSSSPSMVVDGVGNVHVAWFDRTNYTGSGTDPDIFYKCWNVTTSTWTTTEVVSTESTEDSVAPSIAVDGAGNVHVAWQDWTDYGGAGLDRDIFYKYRNASLGNWTTTEVVSIEINSHSVAPSIAVDGAGNVHVAWCDVTDYGGSDPDEDIFYKYRNATSVTWTTMDVVSTESTGSSYSQSIVVDGVENVHVVWEDSTNYNNSGTDEDIFYKLWNATSSTWTMTKVVSTESTGNSLDPSIVVDGAGNIHVAWYDYTNYSGSGTDQDIFYKRWNATSGTWATTEVVSTESTLQSYTASMVMDGSGNVHVAWYDYTDYSGSGTDEDIFYKYRNVTSSTWTMTKVVSTESTGSSYSPSIAVDGVENVHVVWRDNTNYSGAGTDYDIFYKLLFDNGYPYVSQPVDIIITALGYETINWTLFDDFGGGQFRVWVNDTSGTFYVWQNWTSWTNTTTYYISINRSAPGIFNYTIVYNDTYGIWGVPNSVLVNITDEIPYSTTPSTINTNALGTDTINWTLFDDFGGGQFRIWANYTSGTFYVWQNWTSWTNATTYYIPINRSAPGIFNYTIVYNDTYGIWGVPNSVLVNITDENPYSNTPSTINTNALGTDTINWTLFDDFGGGQFCIWANDTSGAFYVWQNWTSWTNATTYYIPINRTIPGSFNYTVIYNDSIGQFGISNTVIVTITNGNPYSDTPLDIITTAHDSDSIDWHLYDDFGGGYFRVWANDTAGNFYIWQNWTAWINTSVTNTPINRSAPGIFNYTIEFNDTYGLWGTPNMVIVTIEDLPPESNHPNSITTYQNEDASIPWILTDDFGVGYYRVFINGTPGTWNSWINNTLINYEIDTLNTGIFNYTIQFNTTTGQMVFDTVIVTIKFRQSSSNPQDDDIWTIIVLIIIGIASSLSVVALGLIRKSKKKIRERDAELEALKKQREELTEEEISLSKEKHICLVHKGQVERYSFVCPGCRAHYCARCVEAIKEIDNECWSCGTPFDATKISKPKDEKLDEVSVVPEKTDLQTEVSKKDVSKSENPPKKSTNMKIIK
jgi:hypothetical protein